jgi:hypothetical protein
MPADVVGERGQAAQHDALAGACAVLHDRDGCRGRHAVRDQPRGDARGRGHAHVEDRRPAGCRERRPVERVGLVAGVRGGQLQRLRMVAVRERDAGVGGAGQGRGDARDDLEGNAVRGQHFEFLAAAAEHEGVAALQAHHRAARARMLEHEPVDARLRGCMRVGAAGRAGLLADVDQLGVAAHAREHVGGDQAVVQHHVGLREHAQRAQGEQARVARPRADEDHPPAASCARLAQHGAQGVAGGIVAAGAQQGRHLAVDHPLEEVATRAGVGKARADQAAVAREQAGQPGPGLVELGLELLAQVAREHGRAAAAGNGDLQRPAFHARGDLHARARRVVDHVRPDPPLRGGCGDGGVDLVVVGGRDDQPGVVQVPGHEGPGHVVQPPGIHLGLQVGHQARRDQAHAGAGFAQGGDFPPRHGAAAHHDNAAAVQVDEKREQWSGTRCCRHGTDPVSGRPQAIPLQRPGEMTGGYRLMLLKHECVDTGLAGR